MSPWGMHFDVGGYVTPSSTFNASLFAERGIEWITRAHARQVDPALVHYETLDGAVREQPFDLAMLLPPFSGVGLKAFGERFCRGSSGASCASISRCWE